MRYNLAGFASGKSGRRIRTVKFKGRCKKCGMSIGKHDKHCMMCGAKQ